MNRVQIFECSTPPTCAQTQIFDISEIDVPEDFALPEVLMLKAAYPFEEQGGGLPESILFSGFAMDGTDLDGNWTYPNSEVEMNLMEMGTDLLASVLAVKSGHPQDEGRSVEIVVGSGADVSVAPLEFAGLAVEAEGLGMTLQDAEGNRIPQMAHGC